MRIMVGKVWNAKESIRLWEQCVSEWVSTLQMVVEVGMGGFATWKGFLLGICLIAR